jgi:hypothetical protein
MLATEHGLGRRQRVDAVGLAGASLPSPRTLDLDDAVTGALQVLAQAGAPAASALDAEDQPLRATETLGPSLQLRVAGRGRGERALTEQLPEQVERHRVVTLLVGIDPTAIIAPSSSSGTVRVMWRPPDRAVSSDVQASMKSRRHPWTTAGDRSLRGHRLASRSVSHPAAAHTLEGASDATARQPLSYARRAPLRGRRPSRTGHPDKRNEATQPVNALASFRLHLLAGRRVLHLEGCVGTLFKNRADSSLGAT